MKKFLKLLLKLVAVALLVVVILLLLAGAWKDMTAPMPTAKPAVGSKPAACWRAV